MDTGGLVGLYERLPVFLLVAVRVGAMIFASPVLGGPYAPATVKTLLTVALAFVFTPLIAPLTIPIDARFAVLVCLEVALGLSVGFLISLVFYGVRMGGEFINRHAGFSAAENFDPESDFGAGPMGDLFHIMLVMIFLASDSHLWFIALIGSSFTAIPLGGWELTPAFAHLLARGTEEMWRISLAISFPVLTAAMLMTMTEGVLARAIPQINVLHISFAMKILVSLLVVWASIPASVAFLGTCLLLFQRIGLAALGVAS
jgi:flagellar biosynthetic protein FliR